MGILDNPDVSISSYKENEEIDLSICFGKIEEEVLKFKEKKDDIIH
jgi:hypothetical protein